MADGSAPVLSCSCLTRLGQWGNQLFQYAFVRILADANGHRLLCPSWLGAAVFALPEGDGDAKSAALAAALLPLVADRVVLSHAGWRKWAATREPMRSMIAQQQPPTASLSGRKIRAAFPQVNGDSLSHATENAASAGNVDLWGWFQFHTSVWAPHEPLWRQLFTPRPVLHRALAALLRRLHMMASGSATSTASSTLVVIHLRCGSTRKPDDGGAHADGEEEQMAAAPTMDGEADDATPSWIYDEWEDRNTFWPTPQEWYLAWLEQRVEQGDWWRPPAADDGSGGDPEPACVLICSDVAAAARSLRQAAEERFGSSSSSSTTGRRPCRFVSWEEVEGSGEMAALRQVWAQLVVERPEREASQLELFRDWWAMTQADVLATSNSTFSFTAAMLSRPRSKEEEETAGGRDGAGGGGPGRRPRFWRPVPEALALQPFEPWDAQPLLQCAEGAGREALYRQGGGGSYE